MKKIFVPLFIFLILPFQGHGTDLLPLLKQEVKRNFKEAVRIRRILHQIPEPCFQEKKTAAFIAEYLRGCGLKVQKGIAGTGMKAVLRGNKASPVVGIRTDIDALPITEATGLPFQSRHPGFMHACGHDSHMTNVLITAKILSGMRDKIPGTIVFVFQPCEEGNPTGGQSGASRMIAEGVLQNPNIDYMLGLHVMPGYPVGSIAVREDAIMANVASVFITIKGKASHGAFPHQGIDAIYAASTAILQFQSLISRVKDPNEKAVLTIGKINGGVRLNVIADEVKMEGTVRTFSFATQDMIEQGMENILKGLQLSHNIRYVFRFSKGSSYVKNDRQLTRTLTPLFQTLLGKEKVIFIEPVTVGEDFSAYSFKIPSLYFFLGTGMGKTLHSPTYAVDEKIFLYGPLLFSAAAVEIMKKHPLSTGR